MRIFISGFTSKRLLISVFLLFLARMLFGVPKITVIAPTFAGTGSNNTEIQALNDEAERVFSNYKNSMETKLGFLPSSVHNLARAFANTSVFASDGASQRGYEGYKALSLTFGFMGAVQFPSNFNIFGEIRNAINSDEGEMGFDFIKDNMDIGLGFDIQAINAQFGINTSKFLLEGLYLGFKFSMFDTNWAKTMSSSGFSFKTTSFGINASYQLIKQKRLLGGLFIWRGLNLGTGYIWQNTNLGLTPALPINEDLKNVTIPITGVKGISEISMPLSEAFHMVFDTNTSIIPIEAMTSIRLPGFLNLALGAGVDVAFGSSNIKANGSIDANPNDIRGLPEDGSIRMDVPPVMRFSMEGKSAPNIFNLKLMGAVGFNLGPVIIDIPVTYYFLNNGYSLGVTLGLTL